MEIFKETFEKGHEQVVFCSDPAAGLKAIIAIHSTVLGPALGGLRMWNYKSEEEALTDVLRLSRSMTYKNAAMGLGLGGGKAVIIGDPHRDKTPELFRAFGRFVESLGGRYITAEDVGTCEEDMNYIAQETSHVVGLTGKSGNPSPVTAYGVFLGIKAAVEWVFGSDDLKGKKVALQGLGHVGMEVARLLTESGAEVTAADIYPDRVKEAQEILGAKIVEPEKIYEVPCDIFSPCALGAIINENTIDRLACKIVAGAANNQLKDENFARRLMDRGILYAPDYIINGGGVINVAEELSGMPYSIERVFRKLSVIPARLKEVFALSRSEGITTAEAADRVTEKRFEKVVA
ncbi:MAG: leucine dehydrogenase [Thermoanaerobacteraceae bacterium]|jgi:leucine dehydrogenase|nr:leucine dehydrogenase [Thermoanaerobacteraceae bacterium]MDN5301234.1 leucine dehydrogenase [Thermoanaerobacteraceae bacterium]RKL61325.1 Glu/Leu/Phe/Val dehydrogenase [Thermoanaerobacteraceae bacterium SP2]